jgi:hypothetical protein
MVSALIIVGFFAVLLAPCVLASRVDLDAEEANEKPASWG